MAEPSDNAGPTQGQRDFIRDAVRKLVVANKTLLGAQYAEAERNGEVPRKSNEHSVDAAKYGERLIEDGLRKGWL